MEPPGLWQTRNRFRRVGSVQCRHEPFDIDVDCVFDYSDALGSLESLHRVWRLNLAIRVCITAGKIVHEAVQLN